MTLKHILGTVPAIKILDFLLDQTQDYTQHEIQRYAEVRPVDMKRDFHCLVDCGVVIETRKIRGASLYKPNPDNHVMQSLILLGEAIDDYETDILIDEVDIDGQEETGEVGEEERNNGKTGF